MKSKSTKQTLVIGGAGYVGSHVVPLLVSGGRSVTVLGRGLQPKYPLPAEAKYITGDFGKIDLIRPLLDNHDEIIHLAYATVPNTSFENPLADLLENLPPTLQLFSEAARSGTKLMLVSSGGTVYGEAVELPISEAHRTRPISPYGVTKLTLENYAYLYAATHALEFVCVRPSNAYGIGQRPFVGQGFIATALASAIEGIPIVIFGQNGMVRDYLYITDLASGLVSALDCGHTSTTYNIGSGQGCSNKDIIDAIEPMIRASGRVIHVEHLPARSFDVQSNILDSNRLRNDTGWAPSVTLTQGLAATHEWMERQRA